VSKGRYSEGWDRFGLGLRLADNLLRVGHVGHTKQLRALKDPKVETKSGGRSYAEVLVSPLLGCQGGWKLLLRKSRWRRFKDMQRRFKGQWRWPFLLWWRAFKLRRRLLRFRRFVSALWWRCYGEDNNLGEGSSDVYLWSSALCFLCNVGMGDVWQGPRGCRL
jgi:hypothetical protein